MKLKKKKKNISNKFYIKNYIQIKKKNKKITKKYMKIRRNQTN